AGARVDQVVQVAPAAPPNAAGSRTLVPKHHSGSAEAHGPPVAGRAFAARAQIATEVREHVAPKLQSQAIGHPALGETPEVQAAAWSKPCTSVTHSEHLGQNRRGTRRFDRNLGRTLCQ